MYNLLQNSLGVRRARRVLAHDYMPKKSALRMLDIGCGTAEILEFLPDDIAYVGFDVSEDYIAQARKRFGHRGVFFANRIRSTHVGDLQPFDVVLAFGVLHHLDDNEAMKLINLAAGALKQDGVLLTVDPCFTQGQATIARWLIEHDRGQSVRTEHGYRILAGRCFARIDSVPRHDLLRVPYTYLMMRCRQHIGQ